MLGANRADSWQLLERAAKMFMAGQQAYHPAENERFKGLQAGDIMGCIRPFQQHAKPIMTASASEARSYQPHVCCFMHLPTGVRLMMRMCWSSGSQTSRAQSTMSGGCNHQSLPWSAGLEGNGSECGAASLHPEACECSCCQCTINTMTIMTHAHANWHSSGMILLCMLQVHSSCFLVAAW